MKRRAVSLILAVAATVALLTACTPDTDSPTPPSLPVVTPFDVQLDDGRLLPCIWLKQGTGNGRTGGPSCDWANTITPRKDVRA